MRITYITYFPNELTHYIALNNRNQNELVIDFNLRKVRREMVYNFRRGYERCRRLNVG